MKHKHGYPHVQPLRMAQSVATRIFLLLGTVGLLALLVLSLLEAFS